MHVTPAPAIDWNSLFLTLQREGYTMNNVAAYTRIARSTMESWRRGAEPRHQDGETVIKFWSEATQLPRESLPVRDPAKFCSRIAQSRA